MKLSQISYKPISFVNLLCACFFLFVWTDLEISLHSFCGSVNLNSVVEIWIRLCCVLVMITHFMVRDLFACVSDTMIPVKPWLHYRWFVTACYFTIWHNVNVRLLEKSSRQTDRQCNDNARTLSSKTIFLKKHRVCPISHLLYRIPKRIQFPQLDTSTFLNHHQANCLCPHNHY